MANEKTVTMSSMAGPRKQDVFDMDAVREANQAIKNNETLIKDINQGKFDDVFDVEDAFQSRSEAIEDAMQNIEEWRDFREKYMTDAKFRLTRAKEGAIPNISLQTPSVTKMKGGSKAGDMILKLMGAESGSFDVQKNTSTRGAITGMTSGPESTFAVTKKAPVVDVTENLTTANNPLRAKMAEVVEMASPEESIGEMTKKAFEEARQLETTKKPLPPVPTARKTAKELGLPEIPQPIVPKTKPTVGQILKGIGGGIVRGAAQAPAFEFMAPPSTGPVEGTPEYELEMGRMTMEDYRRLTK